MFIQGVWKVAEKFSVVELQGLFLLRNTAKAINKMSYEFLKAICCRCSDKNDVYKS